MISRSVPFLIILSAGSLRSAEELAPPVPEGPPSISTPKVEVSNEPAPEFRVEYKPELLAKAIGHKIGRELAATYGPGVSEPLARLPIEEIVTGVRAGLRGEPAAYSPKTAQGFAEELDRRIAASRSSRGAAATAAGDAFLAGNAKKPGILTTPSGIQYEVLTPGSGKLPAVTDTVLVRYRGTLLDGTLFDSNLDAPEPAAWPIDQLVAGSAEMTLSMAPGAKWRFWIPARLAYGNAGNPPIVGPGELLVFEQECIGIQDPETTANPVPPAAK